MNIQTKTLVSLIHALLNPYFWGWLVITIPETNIAPENEWLEDKPFLLGPGNFSGAFAVSFREGNFFIFDLLGVQNMCMRF